MAGRSALRVLRELRCTHLAPSDQFCTKMCAEYVTREPKKPGRLRPPWREQRVFMWVKLAAQYRNEVRNIGQPTEQGAQKATSSNTRTWNMEELLPSLL